MLSCIESLGMNLLKIGSQNSLHVAQIASESTFAQILSISGVQ
jgi:hypothetical protein